MNPWIVLAVVIAFVANGFYWDHNGYGRADTEWTARIQKERADASEKARKDERAQQEKVNEALRKQNETLAGINGRLATDIDRLRKRPERPAGVSEAPRADCTGANGAELGGIHAVFLRRYAALAARYDAALETCYATLDAVSGNRN